MEDFNLAARQHDKDTAKSALALSEHGQFDQALKDLDSALNERDESAILWYAKGKILQRMHHDYDASVAFKKAFDRGPDDTYIVMSFGGLLSKTNNYVDAETVYLTKFDDQKSDIRYLTALGHVYQCLREFDLAVACFGRAAKIDPNDRLSYKRMIEIEKRYELSYTQAGWDDLCRTAQERIKNIAPALQQLQHNHS